MKKIMIFVGTGGVGKTTLAAAKGIQLAKQGKKVLVLTIDPSQRLATTLGLQDDMAHGPVPGTQYSGTLVAGRLKHQAVFDQFIRSASSNNEQVQKFLENPLYKQLSTTFAGSQDFTALIQLLKYNEDAQYDVIILDTPPAQHVGDFLKAPAKILTLFNDSIAKWFRIKPDDSAGFFQKMLRGSTVQALKVLELLTGEGFVKELTEFFYHIQQWQGKLREKTNAVADLLKNHQTEFFLVTAGDSAKLQESLDFARQIKQSGYHLRAVYMNRCFPKWFPLAPPDFLNRKELKELYEQYCSFYREREKRIDQFSQMLPKGVVVMKQQEQNEPIYDLASLERFAGDMEGDHL